MSFQIGRSGRARLYRLASLPSKLFKRLLGLLRTAISGQPVSVAGRVEEPGRSRYAEPTEPFVGPSHHIVGGRDILPG